MSLTKEQIEAANVPLMEEIAIPRWNGSVYVREMTGPETAQWEAIMQDKPREANGTGDIRVWTTIFCLCDSAGKRFFDENDYEKVSKFSGAALSDVCLVALRLNALRKEDQEQRVARFAKAPTQATSISH